MSGGNDDTATVPDWNGMNAKGDSVAVFVFRGDFGDGGSAIAKG